MYWMWIVGVLLMQCNQCYQAMVLLLQWHHGVVERLFCCTIIVCFACKIWMLIYSREKKKPGQNITVHISLFCHETIRLLPSVNRIPTIIAGVSHSHSGQICSLKFLRQIWTPQDWANRPQWASSGPNEENLWRSRCPTLECRIIIVSQSFFYIVCA